MQEEKPDPLAVMPEHIWFWIKRVYMLYVLSMHFSAGTQLQRACSTCIGFRSTVLTLEGGKNKAYHSNIIIRTTPLFYRSL